MARRHSSHLWSRIAIVMFWTACILPSIRATESIEDLRTQARQSEKDGDYGKACAYYSYILSKDRTLENERENFQRCLRHFHRAHRHHDPSYVQQVLTQDVDVALKAYGEILSQLRSEYLESDKADLTRLFRQGLEELRLSLGDESFRHQYLPHASKEGIQSFLARMQDEWSGISIAHSLDARKKALQVALAAKKALGLRPTVTVLEIACGACNALDEHTYYLTPRQFQDDFAALKTQAVGVGIELTFIDRKLMIAQVVINSPAAHAELRNGDYVTRIDREVTDRLSADAAMDRLRGKAGSTVDLEILSFQDDSIRTVSLVRQPVNISVIDYQMIDLQTGLAYLHLANFHENTLQEMDEAIRQLEMQGMKALVIDLRGNPGGLFDAAVKAAERFLGEGSAIVSTRGRKSEIKRVSRNLNPLAAPVVLMVDGETASAAEVFAGALKDNERAHLVGETTFGKGAVQHMVELKTVQAGGIRITWAKFYSPHNQSVSDHGIVPHETVASPSLAYERAQLFLRGRLSMMPP